MSTSRRKHLEAAKKAGESASTAVAATSVVMDVLAIFFKFPHFVKWLVTGAVGLIAGCFSGRQALKEAEEDEKEDQKQQLEDEKAKEDRVNLIGVTHLVKAELDEIKKHLENPNEHKEAKQIAQQAYTRLHKLHLSEGKLATVSDIKSYPQVEKKEEKISVAVRLVNDAKSVSFANDGFFQTKTPPLVNQKPKNDSALRDEKRPCMQM